MIYPIKLAGCDKNNNPRFELGIGYVDKKESKKLFKFIREELNSGFLLLETISDGSRDDEIKLRDYLVHYRLSDQDENEEMLRYDYSHKDTLVNFFKAHPDHESLQVL